MIFVLFIAVGSVIGQTDQCVQDAYIDLTSFEDKIGQLTLSIRLQGEYLIGYGDNYDIRDKNKVQIMPFENREDYRAANIEVLCPSRHILSVDDDIQCEILLNLNTKSASTFPNAQLVLPIKEDDDIRENPILRIDKDFELHLSDVANQLDDMSRFLQYDNCGVRHFVMPEAIEVTAEQLASLRQYAKQLPEGAANLTVTAYMGSLRIENYTINRDSRFHLYGLVLIIGGILILTAIRAFKKREEAQQQQQQEEKLMEMNRLN